MESRCNNLRHYETEVDKGEEIAYKREWLMGRVHGKRERERSDSEVTQYLECAVLKCRLINILTLLLGA